MSRPAAEREVELAEKIRRFVEGAKDPVVLEPGAEMVSVGLDRMAIDPARDGVWIAVWDDGSTLRRRVTGVREAGPGRLELTVAKFGGAQGKALLADRARPLMHGLARAQRRHLFESQFERFLRRQFPRWRLSDCTTHPDLEHSLSPVYPRALVARGGIGWAAIAAPPGQADGVLTYGLIWHDYLRRRERRVLVEGLALFVPEGSESTACWRAACLNRSLLKVAVFRYDAQGWEEPVEGPPGNLAAKLEAASSETPVRKWAGQGPEWWLEQAVRAGIDRLDARLRPAPVYGQVSAAAGLERGIIDLLGVEHGGRLSVVELKASADAHLPVQALDYWMRVRWHAGRGEFGPAGYFPGVGLRRDPPRLLLAAPSMEFHSTTETVLGYFGPEIEVERVGLAVEWGREVRVSFRLSGARRPC
jgi:hypothetical protein